jgi:chromosome segregation ATPase
VARPTKGIATVVLVGVLAAVFFSRGLGGTPDVAPGASVRTRLEDQRRSVTAQIDRAASTFEALGSQAASTPDELAALDGTIAALQRRLDAALAGGHASLAGRLRSAIGVERRQLSHLAAMLVTVESLRSATAAQLGTLRTQLAGINRQLGRLPGT